ncbi:MAG: hypothetical protein M3384_10930 [Acidobacteriota bacterium]|nr:hypothetical protein [Acidobacteriota bacterium]
MKALQISAKSFVTAAAMFLAVVALTAIDGFGQDPFTRPQPRVTPTPKLVVNRVQREMPVAAGNNLYCAGYIQTAPVNTDFEVVGASDEREQNIYAENDYVYISRGANRGVQVGDMFAVTRPRGKFRTRFSRKGNLGIYVEELGAVEVVSVKAEVSVARVVTSCATFLLGDLLQPIPARTSPVFQPRPRFDLFAEPSGKAQGRIVLARDGRETLSAEQVVYIDLGAEDNVRVGDYLTIFRPLGTGGVLNSDQHVSLNARDEGFESETYRGGKFSIQAPRKSGSEAEGEIVSRRDAKSRRPRGLRKIVGEMVILNVRERTATALITRNAQEIHTGDMVELQ